MLYFHVMYYSINNNFHKGSNEIMKKTVITGRVAINAPKQRVWSALADFGNVQCLSPNIEKSYLTSDQKNGVGATRHCDFVSMGSEVEERIVEWNEGESLKIEIYESKNIPMIKGMEAEFKVSEEGGSTVVIGIFKYGMTNVFGGLLNSLTMKKMNQKAWIKFIAGIKHHVETGEDVKKETLLELSYVENE
jgi:carbon monoxide dehydrogenase subunit G